MSNQAIAVIGANFGDEGKGLMTDYLARQNADSVVLRFNGGAQAGHTVQTETGLRHVFGHLGAGSLSGAETLLGRNFIVNPLLFKKEIEKYESILPLEDRFTRRPRVFSDLQCRVTTIYDMVLNSLVELSRGINRHGSCGMGINETVTRHQQFPEGRITTDDLLRQSTKVVAYKFEQIRDKWFPKRLEILGIDEAIGEKYLTALYNRSQFEHAQEAIDAASMLYYSPHGVGDEAPLILEGAQGLMLDEFLGLFPHVTRSITGLPYAIISAADVGKTEIQPIYVTRAYTTRHGAGRLFGEEYSTNAKIVDETNIPNEWQGTLRLAPLDLSAMGEFISADLQRAEYLGQAHGVTIKKPSLALTCLDQMPEETTVIVRGELVDVRTEKLGAFIESTLNINLEFVSSGPTASDVYRL